MSRINPSVSFAGPSPAGAARARPPVRTAVFRPRTAVSSAPHPVPAVGRVLLSRPRATAAEVEALYRLKLSLAPLVEDVLEDEA